MYARGSDSGRGGGLCLLNLQTIDNGRYDLYLATTFVVILAPSGLMLHGLD